MTTLIDRWGNPLRREALDREVAAPTLGGVRSPLAGYPGDGLNPRRLAAILRAADQGDARAYLELAETIEERDPHYLAVLSTRKRAVAQLEVKVEAASDDRLDLAIADAIRDWLTRDDLTEELFDILDCVGKGVSFTEILWSREAGQWRPARLVWRDPRHFTVDGTDLATPRLIGAEGRPEPLPAFKFVCARISAKSGLPLRSGLARVAAWGWMFKAFTLRDWAVFAQTYGQPLRLGRYDRGASEEDRKRLFEAVANIAGDCAAIVPEGMAIEFVEAKGAATDLYERRADWLDRQISKAVLGQTTTTDAVSGGHAVAREHRLVQEDIERADARALAAALNRDLIRPWVDLSWGPRPRYPRLVLVRPEAEDTERLARTLAALVPLGLRVEASEVRDRLGFADPEAGAEVLAAGGGNGAPEGPAAARAADGADPGPGPARLNATLGVFERGSAPGGMEGAAQQERPSAARSEAPDDGGEVAALLAARLEAEAAPAVAAILDQVEAVLAAAESLEEARELLLAAFPRIDTAALSGLLAEALLAAHLAGRAEAEAESADER